MNVPGVELPYALERKYPRTGQEWPWQWVFPARRFYDDRETGERRRHHIHETVFQREMRIAVRVAGITKPATSHSSAILLQPICSKTATT